MSDEPRPVLDGQESGPEAIEGFNVCPNGRVYDRKEMTELMTEFGLEEDEAEMFCDDFGLYE
jgi:hypothetical protein